MGKNITADRVNAANPEALQAWYHIYRTVKTEYQVDKKNIWNMNETDTQLEAYTNQIVLDNSFNNHIYKKITKSRK